MTSATPSLQETLWTVSDLAVFLRRSRRWIWGSLKIPETEPGSIPTLPPGR